MHLIGGGHADAAVADAILHCQHGAVSRCVGDHRRVERGARPDVPDRGFDAGGGQSFSSLLRIGQHLPDREDAQRAVALADPASEQARAHLVLADVHGAATRPADGHRPLIRREAVLASSSWAKASLTAVFMFSKPEWPLEKAIP